jgi:gamma-glutamyltranspeptidase
VTFYLADLTNDRIIALTGLVTSIGGIVAAVLSYLRSGHAVRQSEKANDKSDDAVSESHRACERTYKNEGKLEAHESAMNRQSAQTLQNTDAIRQISKDLPPSGNGTPTAEDIAKAMKEQA